MTPSYDPVYEPNLQRWLNRDPIQEPGFECVRNERSPSTYEILGEILEDVNLYRFVRNAAILKRDSWGLALSEADCDAFLKICMKDIYKKYAIGAAKGAVIGLAGVVAGLAVGAVNVVAGVCVGGAVEVYGAIEAGGDISEARKAAKACQAVYAKCMAAVERRNQK